MRRARIAEGLRRRSLWEGSLWRSSASRNLTRLGLVGLFCIAVLAAAGSTRLKPAPISESIWEQLARRCEKLALKAQQPYPWPIKPFHVQHAVRGYFGDPRTVIDSGDGGAYSFHNGIDISAWTGNHVYPVISGTVVKSGDGRVVVRTNDDREFQYIHVDPRVEVGAQVIASRTILGTVLRRWNHVHLTEIRENCAVNPLMPGHLEPYRDTTRPVVRQILFQDPARRPEAADDLSGRVRILADAYDTPPIPSPFPWNRLPVSPAQVTWTLSTIGGRVLIDKPAADFRFGEPFRSQFCSVYAPGTEQNFAAVAGTFHWGKAGRYLFILTPAALLNTARFPPGRYRVTVVAADTAGNTGSRSALIRIRPGHAPPVPVSPDTRCTAPPAKAVSSGPAAAVTERAVAAAQG